MTAVIAPVRVFCPGCGCLLAVLNEPVIFCPYCKGHYPNPEYKKGK